MRSAQAAERAIVVAGRVSSGRRSRPSGEPRFSPPECAGRLGTALCGTHRPIVSRATTSRRPWRKRWVSARCRRRSRRRRAPAGAAGPRGRSSYDRKAAPATTASSTTQRDRGARRPSDGSGCRPVRRRGQRLPRRRSCATERRGPQIAREALDVAATSARSAVLQVPRRARALELDGCSSTAGRRADECGCRRRVRILAV